MPRAASSHVVDVESFGSLQRASAPCRNRARHPASELLVTAILTPAQGGSSSYSLHLWLGRNGAARPRAASAAVRARWPRQGDSGEALPPGSGDGDLFVQIDVLDAVDEGGAL